MPFDEKEIDLLSDIEPLRSESRGFAPEQMVTCEVCLRANSPTRTSCLTEAVTRSDNERQFTRYSRPRYYLKVQRPELST